MSAARICIACLKSVALLLLLFELTSQLQPAMPQSTTEKEAAEQGKNKKAHRTEPHKILEKVKKKAQRLRTEDNCEPSAERDWERPEIDRAGAIIDDCAIRNLPRTQLRDLNETLTLSPYVATVQSATGDAPSLAGQRSSLTRFVVDGGDYTNLFFGAALGHPESMSTALIDEFQILTPGASKTLLLYPARNRESADQVAVRLTFAGFISTKLEVVRSLQPVFRHLRLGVFYPPMAILHLKSLEDLESVLENRLKALLAGLDSKEFEPVDFLNWGGGSAVTDLTRPQRFHIAAQENRPFSELRGEFFRTEEKPGFRSFSGGASGDPQCRSRPCPYSFDILRFKRNPAPTQAAGEPVFSNNLPVRGFADPSDFKAFDLQAKPSIELGEKGCYDPEDSKFECPLLTISAQYVNFFSGSQEFALLEEEGLQQFLQNDQALFVSPSLFSKFGDRLTSNRFQATFVHERRATLPVVLDSESETVQPTFSGETVDRYQHVQIRDDLFLDLGGGHQFQFGGEWLYHRNQRDLLDERLRRNPPTVQNKTYALYGQYHCQFESLNLHLDLGLRWDHQALQPLLINPSDTAFGEFIGMEIFPSDGTLPNQSALQRRLGLAWATKGHKAILRVGAGRYFARQTLLNQLVAVDGTGIPDELDIVVPPERPDVAVFSRDYRNPRVDAAHVSFQMQLGRADRWLFADFQHSKGVHLTRYFDLNLSDEEKLDSLDVDTSKGFILPPVSGNRVLYTNPPAFERLGEVLVVQSSAKSVYDSLTVGVRAPIDNGIGGWFKKGRIDVSYTYSQDRDDISSENHLFSRPFNRLEFNQDYARSDRDIPHRFNLFMTGELPPLFKRNCKKKKLVCRLLALIPKDPDSLTIRYRKYSAQPSSFNPINRKGTGRRCTSTNSATRVVEGYDCGRNHFRPNDGFGSLDLGLSWYPKSRRFNLVLDFMNILNSANQRRRQDLLRDPFLLEDRRTPFEMRVVFRLFLRE